MLLLLISIFKGLVVATVAAFLVAVVLVICEWREDGP